MIRLDRLMPRVAIALLLTIIPFNSFADIDRYHVTEMEKQACTADAIRLCMDAYPSEQKLLVCMKQNRSALTATCRVAFDAGVKRRRL